MSDIRNFDASLDQAWIDFRVSLADRLVVLPQGETIVLTCSYDVIDPLPSITFSVTGANRVRCEIPPGPRLQLMEGHDLDALVAAGWRCRKNGRYVLELGRRWSDKMAALAVALLRGMWEVPHPAFLTEGGPVEPAIDVAVRPRGRSHLQEMVASVVADLIGEPIVRDDDGNIPLSIGDMSSLLCVRSGEPTVAFYVVLGSGANADEVIREHSESWSDVNLMVVDGDIVGMLTLEATVFVAKNLVSCFAKWIHFMREGAPAIVSQLADGVDEAPLPAAIMCLLHLDPDSTGTLNAHEVAAVCDNDRDAILEYLRICSEQEISWRRSAGDALDPDEAAACEQEAEAWAHTHESLRAALRVVVLPRRKAGRRDIEVT